MICFWSFLTLSLALLSSGDAYKILLSPAIGASHLIYFGRLAKELQSRGHDVSFLTMSRMQIPAFLQDLPWRQYAVDTDTEHYTELMSEMAAMAVEGAGVLDSMANVGQQIEMYIRETTQLYRDNDTLRALKDERYDFIVIDAMFPQFGLPYLLDVPFAYISFECFPLQARAPYLPSYVPLPWMPFADQMSFGERFANFLGYMMFSSLSLTAPSSDYLPPGKPVISASELIARADLCFRLKEKVIDTPRPLNPNMVDMGGVMARPASPLPADIEGVVSSAPHGVILVSFGSIFEVIPETIIRKFVEVFKSVEADFIFKCKHDVIDLPANVHRMEWIPQNDLLGHPKVKLFITHGGVNSLLEAIYQGVPVILFPLGIDQGHNAQIAKTKGYGEALDISSFTAHALTKSIHRVLNDTYKSAVAEGSEFFKSLPPAGDTAEYWIDHVIKYGGKHIRPRSQDMPWYQVIMLDVVALLVICLAILLSLPLVLLKCMCKLCRGKNKPKTE